MAVSAANISFIFAPLFLRDEDLKGLICAAKNEDGGGILLIVFVIAVGVVEQSDALNPPPCTAAWAAAAANSATADNFDVSTKVAPNNC